MHAEFAVAVLSGAALRTFVAVRTAELAVMMGTGIAGMLVEAAVARAGPVVAIFTHMEGRTAFFQIRCLLLDCVVILQSFLLDCGVFRFRCGKSRPCQLGSQNACGK